MKILFATTPIRPEPTTFPPVAPLSMMKYLRKRGIKNIDFYNIDFLRPSFEDAIEYIVQSKPDIIGLSAVVSTAYRYTRDMSLELKRRMPETLIVLGGNLVASANVILEKTGVDVCVNGEGETVFYNLIERARTTRSTIDFFDIPGLIYMGSNNKLINTGFGSLIKDDEIYDYDVQDMIDDGSFEHYLPIHVDTSHVGPVDQRLDDRYLEPHRQNKRLATFSISESIPPNIKFSDLIKSSLAVFSLKNSGLYTHFV